MSTNRPTFNESWYRVADLRPRLRSTLQTHRQQFRGQTWHVAQDPSSNRFFRLDDAGYHFVALLDGRRTVTEAWAICNEQFGDAAPTQSEAIHLLGQLYTANLLQADLPSDAAGLFERDRDRTRREIGGFFMNLLFARIPLFDPDRLLAHWERLLGPLLFRSHGFVAWLTLLAVAAYYLVGRADALVAGASSIIAPSNMLLLYVSLAGIKAVHELGHGLASKYVGRVTGRGGAVHGFGITLLVFTPLPYVDASSSWAFRSKWHRALVGVAGMYVELAVAAVAAIVWANTSPGIVNALAYNVIFVAGVSTLVFNANPLFRFDGYYVLSDILEIPNLSSRSRDHLIYLVKRYVFGLKQAASAVVADGEQWWLPLYGIAAAAYRVIVSVGIVLFVADRFLLIGMLLAVSAVFSWLIVPVGRVVRYLTTGAELARVRRRALMTSGGFAALLIVGVGVVPVPQRAQAEGVLEPFDLTVVRAEADGFVDAVLPSGAAVTPGSDVLLAARNDELEIALIRLLAEEQLTRIQRSAARVEETALAQSLDDRLESLRQQIARTEQRLDALAVVAPARGHWVAPDVERLLGAYVQRGAEIGYVASLDALLVRAVADQRLGPRLESEIGIDAEVRVCVRGHPELEFTGHIQDLLPAGFRRLPSAALGYAAGGAMAVDLEDESGTRSVDPFFEIHVSVPDDAVAGYRLCGGQRVVVRFELPERPLAVIGWRALRQLVQRRFEL